MSNNEDDRGFLGLTDTPDTGQLEAFYLMLDFRSVFKHLMGSIKMTVRLNEIIEKAKDKDVAKLIVCALNKLFERDSDLLEIDANERSITHRLGIYLQENFSELDVDCEYNRNGNEAKYLYDEIGDAAPDDTEGKTVFPDIIIHERKTNGNNKLIIEVKKTNSRQPKEIDLRKLKGLSKQLNYKNALFLRLHTGPDETGVAEFCWVNPNQMDDNVNNYNRRRYGDI